MPTLTFSRASAAYHPETGQQVAAEQPRYVAGRYGQGVLVEEGTTNLIRNSMASGGGSLPSNWFDQPDSGLSVTYSRGTEPNGDGYVDVSITNNSGSAKNYRLFFEDKNAIAAAAGEVLVCSAELQLISGSLGGGLSLGLGFHWYTSALGYNGEASTSLAITTSAARYASNAATAPANTAYARPRLQIYSIPNGASFTVRVKRPQAEKKSYATSYLPTAGSAAIRSAETLSFPTAGVLGAAGGTIALWAFVDPAVGGTVLWHTTDPAAPFPRPNSIRIYRTSSNRWSLLLSNAAGQSQEIQTPGDLSRGWHHFAVRWSAGEAAFFVDGSRIGSVANPYTPQAFAAACHLGSGGTFGYINGPVDDVRVYPRALDDAEVGALFLGKLPPATDEILYAPCDGSLPGSVGFTRSTAAYHPETGTIVFANQPRYAKGVYGQALLVEEGTTNLLTADQSSFEGGTSGWSLRGGSARDSTRAWHGSYSVKLTRTVSSGYQGLLDTGVADARPASPGTAYAASAWVWPTGLTGAWTFRVEAIDASGATISRYGKNGWTAGAADEGTAGGRWFLPTSPGGAWQRFVVPIAPTPANTAKLRIWIFNDSGGAGDYGWIDAIQLEQKPYATSFVPGGTTRSAEKAGPYLPSFDAGRGAVGLWVYLTPAHRSGPEFCFMDGRTTYGSLSFTLSARSGGLYFACGYANYTLDWSRVATPGWAHLLVRWGDGFFAAFYNGAKVFERDSFYGAEQPNGITIGSKALSTGSYANTLFDDVRVYNRPPSDAEVAALAGIPQPTAGESLYAPLDSSLSAWPASVSAALGAQAELQGDLHGLWTLGAILEGAGELRGDLRGLWTVGAAFGGHADLHGRLTPLAHLAASLTAVGAPGRAHLVTVAPLGGALASGAGLRAGLKGVHRLHGTLEGGAGLRAGLRGVERLRPRLGAEGLLWADAVTVALLRAQLASSLRVDMGSAPAVYAASGVVLAGNRGAAVLVSDGAPTVLLSDREAKVVVSVRASKSGP